MGKYLITIDRALTSSSYNDYWEIALRDESNYTTLVQYEGRGTVDEVRSSAPTMLLEKLKEINTMIPDAIQQLEEYIHGTDNERND